MASDPNDTSSDSTKQRRRNSPTTNNIGWFLLILVGVGVILLYSATTVPRVYWSDFVNLLQNDHLEEVIQRGDYYEAELKEGHLERLDEKIRSRLGITGRFSVERLIGNDADFQKLLSEKVSRGLKVYTRPSFVWAWQVLVTLVIPLVIFLLILFVFIPRFRDPIGGGFLSNYIKSPAKRYERSKLRVTFEDVAGLQYAKSELQEIVEFLRSPEKFQRLGAVVPKGVLLVGPPGTGKTLVARAVAGEAGVPFYSISGSEFIQMFVGVGASRVRDMFKTAKENAPCILFIDEIDAVGRMRGAGLGGGSDEREQTLNQILSEMDGFTPTETVIVMAATNRPDVLDSALLRPGRFDRHITVDRPTWQGRLQILKVHTRNKPLAEDVNLETIARGMIGMTGADLRNLANEAALLATRKGKKQIDRADFEAAADRVLIGAKREEVLGPEEKKRTAYHEAGHTICAWLTPKADPIFKVTIVPRGRAAGVTRFRPEEDKVDYTLTQLRAQLIVALGGRAADRLIYQETTTGASGDLKQASRIARMMVTQFGMSEKIGPVAYRIGEEHVFLGKEIQEARDFGEGTADLIDTEVRRILREADEMAYRLLEENRHLVEKLVIALLEKEELLKEEIDVLFGQPQAENKQNDTTQSGIIAEGFTSQG
ncbi:MAG: ATP-dependent metallopeptidase FtsH/Yme1/Tma family protein [Planctomycetia bacterium]|nr:ATP-dependent metallopeptidase FtsH/Yme1/Tma family protein [Planctomycetia bacterium]